MHVGESQKGERRVKGHLSKTCTRSKFTFEFRLYHDLYSQIPAENSQKRRLLDVHARNTRDRHKSPSHAVHPSHLSRQLEMFLKLCGH